MVILCEKRSMPIVGVMSFSKDRHERFSRCSKCREETNCIQIKDSELNFREILHRAMQK